MITMRYTLKLYPTNDQETALAQATLGRLQSVVTTTPAFAAEVSEVVQDPSGFTVVRVLEVDGISDLITPTPTTGLNIGGAHTALLAGKRIAAQGWNGQGMYLFLIKSAGFDGPTEGFPTYTVSGVGAGAEVQGLQPWIGMKTADGRLVPWLASQSDLLREDYYIVQ
jgi:Protein of unknown function (DUF2829)